MKRREEYTLNSCHLMYIARIDLRLLTCAHGQDNNLSETLLFEESRIQQTLRLHQGPLRPSKRRE